MVEHAGRKAVSLAAKYGPQAKIAWEQGRLVEAASLAMFARTQAEEIREAADDLVNRIGQGATT